MGAGYAAQVASLALDEARAGGNGGSRERQLHQIAEHEGIEAVGQKRLVPADHGAEPCETEREHDRVAAQASRRRALPDCGRSRARRASRRRAAATAKPIR